MEIEKKLSEIIPPNDFEHRWEFNNYRLIDGLNNVEKEKIETALIEKLYINPKDLLIIETLSYMKSKKAVPAMVNSLNNCNVQVQRIIISASIYSINSDVNMIDVARNAFKQLSKNNDLVYSFSYLKNFNA